MLELLIFQNGIQTKFWCIIWSLLASGKLKIITNVNSMVILLVVLLAHFFLCVYFGVLPPSIWILRNWQCLDNLANPGLYWACSFNPSIFSVRMEDWCFSTSLHAFPPGRIFEEFESIWWEWYIYIFKLLDDSLEKPNNISILLAICLAQTTILNFVKTIPMSVLEFEWKLVNNLIVSSDLPINFFTHLFSISLVVDWRENHFSKLLYTFRNSWWVVVLLIIYLF